MTNANRLARIYDAPAIGVVRRAAAWTRSRARSCVRPPGTPAALSQLIGPVRAAMAVLAATVLAASTVLVQPARADIFRCNVNGTTVFTDQPCDGGKTVQLGNTNTTTRPDSSNYTTAPRHYSSAKWHVGADGYHQAKRVASASQAPMILYFRTDWCGFCRDVERNLFPQTAAVDVMRGFVKVRINPELGAAEQALFEQYRGRGFPTFLVEPYTRMPLRVSVTRAPTAANPARNVSAQTLVTRLERFLPEPQEPPLTSAAAYIERAMERLDRADPAAAASDIKRAIALQPRRPQYYQLLCEAAGPSDQFRQCLQFWSRYIELEPADPAGFAGRSAAHSLAGNLVQAGEDAQRARQLGGAARAVEPASAQGGEAETPEPPASGQPQQPNTVRTAP